MSTTVCPGCGRETLDDQLTCGDPLCSIVPVGPRLAAASVGARFVKDIGASPPVVARIPPNVRGFFGFEERACGRDPDDLALLLHSLGCDVEIVQVQQQGGCRLRDRKTGQWFIVEEGTGCVYMVGDTKKTAPDSTVASELNRLLEIAAIEINPRRLRSCVERWPECATGSYDPRCCRFPKSCSCDVHHGPVDEQYLEEEKP